MRLLLDTVTFIWAVSEPQRISTRAMRSMQGNHAQLEVSSISLSEIAIKQKLGKLDFNAGDVRTAISDLKLRVLPYTANHAMELFDLPPHHGDPFDRQIIAQAMSESIAIVTSDEKFKAYQGLQVIW